MVLVALGRRGLRGHVVDVVDLRCTGMVVSLLDGMGSLRRRFSGLGLMDLLDLLVFVSSL